jgi:hypothetical protein
MSDNIDIKMSANDDKIIMLSVDADAKYHLKIPVLKSKRGDLAEIQKKAAEILELDNVEDVVVKTVAVWGKEQDEPPKGYCLGHMNIYKHEGMDCSNGGISSVFDEVVIWSGFDVRAPENAVVIVEDICMGNYRIRACPARHSDRGQFGGSFIFTCNAVVTYSNQCIKLFDRFENKK